MTAAGTALQVVRWAATDVRAPLPQGDLENMLELAEAPDAELLRDVGRLSTVTAARLRLSPPPLGDGRPPGIGPALLAAAVGGARHGEQARELLRAVPEPLSGRDLLAHHGLAGPALRLLPGLAERLRVVSPLTGALDRPGHGADATCEDLLDRLRAERSGRALLVREFARPPDGAEQAAFRSEWLAFVRHEDPGFVLDIYETALAEHLREHQIRVRVAWSHILGQGSPAPAVPIALWWRALAELEAAKPGLLRERRLPGFKEGTNLYRRARRMEVV